MDVNLPTIFDILRQVDKTKSRHSLPEYLNTFNAGFTSARDNTLCTKCEGIGELKRQDPVRQLKCWWRCNYKKCQHRYSLLVGTILINKKFSLGYPSN